MTTKEILLEQFTACYDDNGWFVAVKNALQNLSAEQAAWKPENSDNSIWEIVYHLNFYNRAYLERFKGVDYDYSTDDNDETFVAAESASEDEWLSEVAELDRILGELRNLVEAADESKFGEPVSRKNHSSWASLLAHLNAHNAHHGGQIVLLRKLQKSWDKAKGVS